MQGLLSAEPVQQARSYPHEAGLGYKWRCKYLICSGQDACLWFRSFLWKRLKGGVLPSIKEGIWCISSRLALSTHEWEWVWALIRMRMRIEHREKMLRLTSFGRGEVKVEEDTAYTWKRALKNFDAEILGIWAKVNKESWKIWSKVRGVSDKGTKKLS